ncbi:MAG TPA: class I SAM-dependent methyltransferase [Usitatibacter sp.]|nr:class I SAM-dependent methyltransferase [Usitatibacter sp.]
MTVPGAPLDEVRARRWFYEFDLPDGSRTSADLPPGVASIHATRREMLDRALRHALGEDYSHLGAADLACHQGWFSLHLAQLGFREVLGIDARQAHLDDMRLMAKVLGIGNVHGARLDIEEAHAADIGTHDVTVMLGLLYHLENPVRALRLARAVTRRLFIVETQLVPHVEGRVEWGSQAFQRSLKGIFGVIDETLETHGPEAGTHGICLAPSLPALAWLLQRVGFENVTRILPPEGGNEQLVRHRRAMFMATVPAP